LVALGFVHDATVRFTMGAFALRIDGVTVLIGCAVGFALGLVGAMPPAMRVLRQPIVDGLRTA
jgi:hypothetical protein